MNAEFNGKILEEAEIRGISLKIDQLSLLSEFKIFLLKENVNINLVSRRQNQMQTILDQILASLILQPIIEKAEPEIVMDLGSGGGLPGIPLSILNPGIQFHLLEAKYKRAIYLKKAVIELHLDNTKIIRARVEKLANQDEYRNKYDMITVRSVANICYIYGCANMLLSGRGFIVAYTGSEQVKKEDLAILTSDRSRKPVTIRSLDTRSREETPSRLILIGSSG